MKRFFCTYFNDNYLLYGLTMFRTLKATGIDFRLFVLCLDDAVHRKLSGFDPLLEPVRLAELEAFDPETAACKANRSMVEYFFTLSPALPLFLMARNPEIDILAYVDSDFMFFSSPEPIFEELGGKSLLVFEHDFAACRRKEALVLGRFNVGFQLYRNAGKGVPALQWWRKKCIEWCGDRPEPGRFADQKYLDEWPELFPGEVVVAEATRAQGLAPWNVGKHRFSLHDGHLHSDGKPLIFFHFQNCKVVSQSLLWTHLWEMQTIPWRYDYSLYHRYWRELAETGKAVAVPENTFGVRSSVNSKVFDRSKKLRKLPAFLRRPGNVCLGIWHFKDLRPWGLRLFTAPRAVFPDACAGQDAPGK